MNVTRALVCGLSGSRAVCPFLMRSASCRYPVCIRWCPFDLSCERSTLGQVREFHGRISHAHYLIVHRTFWPFLIRYIVAVSVLHPLHVRLLTVVYPFLVRCVCAPYNFRDNFHHRINIFFSFFLSVWRPLPFSVNMWQHHQDSFLTMNFIKRDWTIESSFYTKKA